MYKKYSKIDTFQTKIHYSKSKQEGILLPDVKKQLKIRTLHPYEKYTTTSEVLDLAIIVLVEGFSLSQKVAINIWDRMGLQNGEFSMRGMSICLLSNHLGNGVHTDFMSI